MNLAGLLYFRLSSTGGIMSGINFKREIPDTVDNAIARALAAV